MTYQNLELKIEAGIATITVNRPKVLNALNMEVLQELQAAFMDVQKKPNEVQGVILTGAGDKAFVAGADIAAMQKQDALGAEVFVKVGHDCMRTIENCTVPVIACVNGFALGGGMELALACDFIYAAKSAKLGLPEVGLGLFPGFGGTQRLARAIGSPRAKEFIYTAAVVNAEQAFELGIVNQVFEAQDLLAACQKTLQTIRSKAPIAVRLAKKVINEGADLSLSSGLAFEEAQFPIVFATEDKTEGVTAFLEKRKPEFKGK